MRTNFPATRLIAGSAILLALIPTAVFFSTALFRGMGVPGAVAALGEQMTADKTNLLVVSLLGLLPLLLIALLLMVRKIIRKTWDDAAFYALAGVLPVVAVTLLVNLEYWPSYLPARRFLGFPHGLEFVIGPFVFAPIGVLLGFLIAWIVRKQA
jgi:hypothetical protein